MSAPTTHAELAAALADALTRARGDLFDALYSVEGVGAEDRRALVIEMRDQSKAMFEQARAKLGGAAVELVEHAVEGAQLRARVEVAGGPTLDIVVDDVHARGGALRTHDLIALEVV